MRVSNGFFVRGELLWLYGFAIASVESFEFGVGMIPPCVQKRPFMFRCEPVIPQNRRYRLLLGSGIRAPYLGPRP